MYQRLIEVNALVYSQRTRKISCLCWENYTIDRYLISYMPIA